MDSNVPQSATLRDAHFRSPQRAEVETHRKGRGWIVGLILIALIGVGIWAMFFRNKASPGGAGAAQGAGRGAGAREVPVVATSARQGDLPL
jgi:hypothetical protein